MQTPRQQAVVDKLRDMIVLGKFQGGDRLLEIPLSERLNVSRTPIREALIMLAEEGLVEYRPNRGYIVRNFTIDDIIDTYAVRGALECFACRLLAERGIDAETKKILLQHLDEGDRILAVQRLTIEAMDAWGAMNEHFHTALVQATKNGALQGALSRTMTIPYSSASQVVRRFAEDEAEGLLQLRFVHAEHRSLYNMICKGDVHRAEMTMRKHIEYAAHYIRESYLRVGCSDEPSSVDSATSDA